MDNCWSETTVETGESITALLDTYMNRLLLLEVGGKIFERSRKKLKDPGRQVTCRLHRKASKTAQILQVCVLDDPIQILTTLWPGSLRPCQVCYLGNPSTLASLWLPISIPVFDLSMWELDKIYVIHFCTRTTIWTVLVSPDTTYFN